MRTYWQRLLDEKYRKFEKRVAAAPARAPAHEREPRLPREGPRHGQADEAPPPTRLAFDIAEDRGRRRRRRTRARWKPRRAARAARAHARAADQSHSPHSLVL